MQNVIRDFRSEPLRKAIYQGNSTAVSFAGVDAVMMEPDQPSVVLVPSIPAGDGVYENGFGAMVAAGRLLLLPYGDGALGASFSLRVYGWRSFQDANRQPIDLMWVPHLLAELACVLCNRGGPPNQAPNSTQANAVPMEATERFCDTIVLVQGSLGLEGEINSTGPGTDLIATATVDLKGCQFFSFEFSQTVVLSPATGQPSSDPVSMNAFWTRL